MKQAFTMIELVFVIVILGILAAVAIPKLALTTNDAKGAKTVHELSVCINDAGAYYLKNGTFGGLTQAGASQAVSCKHADVCFDFEEHDENGSLVVTNDTTQTDAVCVEAQRIANQNLLATTHVINF